MKSVGRGEWGECDFTVSGTKTMKSLVFPSYQCKTMEESSSSSSDEELELLGLVVATLARKKKRKHKVWVRELFRNRETDGIHKLVNVMQVSNRDLYFK